MDSLPPLAYDARVVRRDETEELAHKTGGKTVWNLGLHRLRGTVQYPERPFFQEAA